MPRTRNTFDPKSKEPFTLSRSKLELFHQCPRCFYIDRRLGIGHVSGPAFTLNSATDTLLKKEFDLHRKAGTSHPLMQKYKIDAIPFRHPDIDMWRENFKGVQYLHKSTNLLITGALDDVWVDPMGTLMVVDYKSTSTTKEISLEDEWKQTYKRQLEIYQWLMRRNGFTVSDTGHFVYVNADTGRECFDGKLEFDMQIISYTGRDDWVEKTINNAHDCLMDDQIPDPVEECEWCQYNKAMAAINCSGK